MRTRRDIEEQVDELLKKYGISDAPIPVDLIAKSEGIAVIETPLKSEVSGALIQSQGISGIAVNSSHHPNRRRFTVAHELAHYLLQHKGKEDHIDWQFTIIRRDGVSSEASDFQEIEANFFAASLLMPKQMVREDVSRQVRYNGEPEANDDEMQQLARKYQVSESAIRYRLINLGLLSPL